MSKLVEISTIEFPPQLVDHQAQHLIETFSNSVERQGLQLQQYLRMVGKEQETFEQELREQAEGQVRRSLALDAFADAESIDADENDPEYGRQRRAIARLIEVATGSVNGSSQENAAEQPETSDTGSQSGETPAPVEEV